METNQYAEQRQNEMNARDCYWVPTTVPEMESFFAINILMGIHQLPEIDSYWSTDDRLGVPGVARVMPKRRYKKLDIFTCHTAKRCQLTTLLITTPCSKFGF